MTNTNLSLICLCPFPELVIPLSGDIIRINPVVFSPLLIRLGIIEDDGQLLRAFTEFFSVQPGISCTSGAGSVAQFMDRWPPNESFDIVLSDIGLPGESGIEGISRIRNRAPGCQVMMVTVYDDSERIFQALCAGATGYLLKQTPLSRMLEAVRSLHEGGAPMSPGIARKVVAHFNPGKVKKETDQLTVREVQIVRAIEEGLTNKEVAVRLDISAETVKSHIKNIYQKLEITSRYAIIRRQYR